MGCSQCQTEISCWARAGVGFEAEDFDRNKGFEIVEGELEGELSCANRAGVFGGEELRIAVFDIEEGEVVVMFPTVAADGVAVEIVHGVSQLPGDEALECGGSIHIRALAEDSVKVVAKGVGHDPVAGVEPADLFAVAWNYGVQRVGQRLFLAGVGFVLWIREVGKRRAFVGGAGSRHES